MQKKYALNKNAIMFVLSALLEQILYYERRF